MIVSRVRGLAPPAASVAAITARSSAVTSSEHCLKYRSSTASTSSPTISALRSRYAIARLRCPVSRSETYTPSSSGRLRPAKPDSVSVIRRSCSSESAPATSPAVAIAPALIIGLRGRPVVGSRLIALNASPLGSTPTFSITASTPMSCSASAYTNGFEIDWIVNAYARIAHRVHVAIDRRDANREVVRICPPQFRDVRRDAPLRHAPEPLVQLLKHFLQWADHEISKSFAAVGRAAIRDGSQFDMQRQDGGDTRRRHAI